MKVCIAGYGAEGKVNYEYWSKLGYDVAIADERTEVEDLPEGVHTILGEGAFEKLHDYDLVVRTASLNPARIFTHGKIWSATNEFFAKCPAKIIGVTGTKGKGTTCTLIAEILKAAGKKVHLVGNIGVPALRELDDIKEEDIVVFELSSFQLWDLEKSPETAVVLMIEPDHMDVHASMEEYVDAKANITIHQTSEDVLVYHPSNKYTGEIASSSKARKVKYMSDEGADVKNGQVIIDGKIICKTEEVGLLGEHNLQNICAAVTAAWRYTQDADAIKKAVIQFKGLPHRLEFVRELNGVTYINDSFSSAPGATVAAIKAFKKPVILIAGGYNKGVDYSVLATLASELQNLKKVLLIGDVKNSVAHLFSESGFDSFEVLDSTTFVDIVKRAQSLAVDGDVVLLSPGTSSFDMFKNFYERGEQFKTIVNELK